MHEVDDGMSALFRGYGHKGRQDLLHLRPLTMHAPHLLGFTVLEAHVYRKGTVTMTAIILIAWHCSSFQRPYSWSLSSPLPRLHPWPKVLPTSVSLPAWASPLLRGNAVMTWAPHSVIRPQSASRTVGGGELSHAKGVQRGQYLLPIEVALLVDLHRFCALPHACWLGPIPAGAMSPLASPARRPWLTATTPQTVVGSRAWEYGGGQNSHG